MKRYILSLALVSMLLPTAAFAGEAHPLAQMEQQMQVRDMELKMAQRKTEVRFKEEMAKLELEQRRLQMDRERNDLGHWRPHRQAAHPVLCLWLIGCFVVHILAAVWVYRDMRERSAGSGIWIVIVLLAGLFGALVYALVRLGDINNNRRPRR